ncbi:MAG: hypothetical protein AB7V48_16195 [Sedimentibacter sp.]
MKFIKLIKKADKQSIKLYAAIFFLLLSGFQFFYSIHFSSMSEFVYIAFAIFFLSVGILFGMICMLETKDD